MAIRAGQLPEQGQLVSVRSRPWIVHEVRPSTLPAPALGPTFIGPQNLITLSSVEDDGLGEVATKPAVLATYSNATE